MLDSLRKNTSSWLLRGLLLLCAIAMGMFGVDKLGGGASKGGDAAAWVNGDVITRYEFDEALSQRMSQFQQMLGDQFDERLLMNLRIPEQTLDYLIQSRLLSQTADQMDMLVTDAELSAFIKSIPQLKTKDGKFDIEAYRRIPNRGLIERRERARLQVSKLQTYVEDRIRLTPAEIQRNYALQNTKVKLKYAVIDFAELAKKYTPSKAEMESVVASTSPEELEKVYQEKKDQFTTKAKVQLRQIRAGIPFQAAAEVKLAARKTIDEISKDLHPENFAEVAKKRSDDEFAKKGGEVGWIDRGTLDPALESAIDSLAPGQVSGPIETSFGYFILLVEDKKDEVVRPLQDVKMELAKEIAIRNHKKKLEETQKAEWEKVLAEGKSIESDLKKQNIAIKTTRQFSLLDGRIPEIGEADAILADIYSLTKENPIAKKLYLFRDKYYFIALDEVTPANMQEFGKEYASVETSIQSALRNQLVQQWVETLKKDAKIKKEINFGGEQQPTAIQ